MPREPQPTPPPPSPGGDGDAEARAAELADSLEDARRQRELDEAELGGEG